MLIMHQLRPLYTLFFLFVQLIHTWKTFFRLLSGHERFTQNANVTLLKATLLFFGIEVDFSELSHFEQRHQPVTMVVRK